MKVKTESPAVRCEICHQSDCFDRNVENCSRCNGIIIKRKISSPKAFISERVLKSLQTYILPNRDLMALVLAILLGWNAPMPRCGNFPYHLSWPIFTLIVCLFAKRYVISLGVFTMITVALSPWIKTYLFSTHIYFEDYDSVHYNTWFSYLWAKFFEFESGWLHFQDCLSIGLFVSLFVFGIKKVFYYLQNISRRRTEQTLQRTREVVSLRLAEFTRR